MHHRNIFSLLTAGLILAATTTLQASNWNGAGDGTTWGDTNNWIGGTAPGINIDSTAEIGGVNNGTRTVGLNTVLNDITVGGSTFRVDGGQGVSTTTVNIGAGGLFNATLGNSLLTINEGGPNGPDGDATVNVGGSLTIGQIRLSRDNSGGTATLAIQPGGSVNMTGGGNFVMRADAATGAKSIFSMTGGSFVSGGSRSLLVGVHSAEINLSGNASFDGQNLTLRMDDRASNGGEVSVNINGNNLALAQFKAINAFGNASNGTGTNVFNFTADATGVSALAAIGALDLVGGDGAGGTQFDADLVLDLTGYSGGATSFTLFTFGSLNGEFGNVTVNGAVLDSIDYGVTTPNAIVLNIIPEPTTLALFCLGALCMAVRRMMR